MAVISGTATAVKYVSLVEYGIQYCVLVVVTLVGAIPPTKYAVLEPSAYNITSDEYVLGLYEVTTFDVDALVSLVLHP